MWYLRSALPRGRAEPALNPAAVGSLDQVHGPRPLGVSGAEPGVASQAHAAGRSGASELQPT